MTIQPFQQFSYFDDPATYRIVVGGHIAPSLSERLQDMTVNQFDQAAGNGTALSSLTGELEDQAALAGVLSTLYDLHFTLLSVEQLPSCGAASPGKASADQNIIA